MPVSELHRKGSRAAVRLLPVAVALTCMEAEGEQPRMGMVCVEMQPR